MAWRRQSSCTFLRLAIDTGWPPSELLVTVITQSGILSAPFSFMKRAIASTSASPLNGATLSKSRAPLAGKSMACAPEYSTLARVVSKWELEIMYRPLPPMTEKRIFSAARPWCTGIISFRPVSSRTCASKL